MKLEIKRRAINQQKAFGFSLKLFIKKWSNEQIGKRRLAHAGILELKIDLPWKIFTINV